jgi:hypothetical protein
MKHCLDGTTIGADSACSHHHDLVLMAEIFSSTSLSANTSGTQEQWFLTF